MENLWGQNGISILPFQEESVACRLVNEYGLELLHLRVSPLESHIGDIKASYRSRLDAGKLNRSWMKHGTQGEGNILVSPALVIQPTGLSDPLIQRTRTPCVFGGYLVSSGIESRTSGLESDTVATRLPTAANRPYISLTKVYL
ncbi:hypothetical protein TNCV_4373191 [Trichonephila clavipes]|uniref:Uncharacterized protein n=1 Tax=Trichonephila clavipes TaxID=2585209 RepID=A0A8X6UZR5_TRICX|nr:hypothetical protein TNCV_4373191 [Trichonephila clavipes]